MTFRVTDSAGRPVEAALVEAVALDTGEVPAPINETTIAELTTDTRLADWTNASGEARLVLLDKRPHRLLVDPPPFAAARGEAAGGRWILDPATRTLTPADDAHPPAGLQIEIVR